MHDDLGFLYKGTGEPGDIIAGALALASRGIAVFPCRADKKPAVPHWPKLATTDPNMIRALFTRPGAVMIGMPTGSRSRLIAVDIDRRPGKDGMAWLDSVALPDSRMHETPSGGRHVFFRAPEGVTIKNSANKPAIGVDVRGEGGYVVMPPSPGYVTINDAPPAEMPGWLVAACQPPASPEASAQPSAAQDDRRLDRYAKAALDGEIAAVIRAPEGQRNHRLNVAAFSLGSLVATGGLSRSMVEAALTRAALGAGLDAKETAATIKSGIEAGMATPRVLPERERVDGAAQPPPEAAGDGAALLWVDRGGWDATTTQTRPWLAPGYLLRGSVTILSGAGGVSKSTLALAWAASIALGEAFHRFAPLRRGKVLLLNCEDDQNEQRLRTEGLLTHFGITPDHPIIMDGNLIRVGVNANGLLVSHNPKNGELSPTPMMRALETLIVDEQADLVILDPLVELHNAEENNNAALRAVVAHFRELAKRTGTAVLIIHHARKGASASPGDVDTMRGASAIAGAARVVLTVSEMQPDDAAAFGMTKAQSKFYLRVDNAKRNYTAPSAAEWFHRQGHVTVCGEEVGIVEPWVPPKDAVPEASIEEILADIAKGAPNGEPWSPQSSGSLRSCRALFERYGIDGKAARRLLDDLLTKHGATVGKFKDKSRNVAEGLRTKEGLPAIEWIDAKA